MAKKKKGKAAVVEEASEVEKSRAPKPESVNNGNDWGTLGASKNAAKFENGEAAAVAVEGNSKDKDSQESKPGTVGRDPDLLPFETALSPARQKIYMRLGVYSHLPPDRKRNSRSTRSCRSSSRASSLILQPRDKSSERDNASVRTNPHPWDSSSNASRPSKPQATRPRARAVSSSASSDISALEDGYSLATSESTGDSHESWEEVSSDDMAPSDSDSVPRRPSTVEQSISEGSLYVGDGNTTQRGGTFSPDIRPQPVFFPPRATTGHSYPGYHPGYNYPVTPNPFTTYAPPPSPLIPVPPPSSSEDLNIGSQSLFTCTLGMMLIGLDLKFFPRTFTLNGETSLLKYMTTIELSALQGPVMMYAT